MKYDYGDPARGLSFEYTNFFDTLVHMGHDVFEFDFMSLFKQHGRKQMNKMLIESIHRFHPKLCFFVLFKDEFELEVIRQLSNSQSTITYNWFTDDHWRFTNFSRNWAPNFNWVSTTDAAAIPKYQSIGCTNVIKTQWACNHFSYKKYDLPLKYDVTFIGQPYGHRKKIIQSIVRAGIRVECWGYGWKNGRVEQQEMIKIFQQTKINLNLSKSFRPWWKRVIYGPGPEQIKGRNFEVPGTGGFLLSGYADNLDDYYAVGKEIEVFKDDRDLVRKIQYYLEHEDKRAVIAEAGYARTIRDHTYEKRFNDIFTKIGLQ